jgi:hypothetical protein
MHRKNGLLAAVALATMLTAAPASALVINLNDTGGVAVGSQAYTGFRAAADFWQAMLTDNITVNLNVGFTSTGFSSPNIIGQTQSAQFTGVLVDEVYGALTADAATAVDAIAVANQLPLTQVDTVYGFKSGALEAITQKPKNPDGTGILQNVRVNGVETVSNREFDADGSRNNYDLRVNSANLKALGFDLTGAYNGLDGIITFNSAFNFDFDPTNGVGVGQTDFIGTAIHEIGHALGFTSGVDIWDNPNNANNNALRMDNQALQSVLDLFRFSDNPFDLGGDGPRLDWSVGNAVGGRPYFSLDAGASRGLMNFGGDEGYFSTGASAGDGRQASHWQDTAYQPIAGDQGPGNPRCLRPIGGSLGILDPTFAPCEIGRITSLDLAAFDAIGWDLSYNVLDHINRTYTSGDALQGIGATVPEPSTWANMLLGFGVLGGALRTRRRLVRARA